MRFLTAVTALPILFSSYFVQASNQHITELVNAAKSRTLVQITYDGSYRRISYPMGDVPAHIGVCTDVIIRSYRQLGIDLQQQVHEDISAHFDSYPSNRIWGMKKPDSNIDHRRVPNLQTFFTRHGEQQAISNQPEDYLPGDIVTWMLPGNLPHIGIVVDIKDPETQTPLVVHNIGQGPEMDNSLFRFPITGHYRYMPDINI
ncbi:DUF1287 domain-containing protein [Teredinibacter sp. KSP-S5-2]|uniref:DUF1287 domain-containing protein n=1 Tax=Teredinibacter sp. KSP-S5-2 TaxID=3034506 RepID=UPI002934E149|nr:DUF1287 domain-containing protein [Teredinibacter sp. KSP-S5-2]WNO09417.1 DUF1287 domain-containing protein [Teredinibacter sp. KSP-S5-2]